ncbi:MAG: MGDG synthase family glycosyltransferase [Anaerolineae bacterium]
MAKKRVLIMTSKLGFGHMSAANAIAAALDTEHPDVEVTITNPAQREDSSDLLKDIHGLYDESSKREGLYEFLYKLSDTGIAAAATNSAVAVMLRDAVYKTIEEYQPDVIVVVHEDYLAPLKSIYEMGGFKIPIVTVITDLTTIHRRWFSQVSKVTVVPTEQGAKLASDHGLLKSKMRQIGVPVTPAIVQETRSTAEIRQELGWDADKTVALVVGSKRVSNLVENLHAVNHSGLDVQLALVAGGDDKLYWKFQQTDWHLPVSIYNYVDNIPAMIKASDLVISKAGGLIVSESLAAGKPILITDVIEGQETGNANYVIEKGVGDKALNALDVLETLYHWLQDDRRILTIRAEKARAIGQPRAAFEIAELVLELADA